MHPNISGTNVCFTSACSAAAPVMMIKTEDNDETYGNLTKDSVIEILNQIKEKEEKSEGEIIA